MSDRTDTTGTEGTEPAQPPARGAREIRVVVHAPTDENAASRAQTIADLVAAEHGQDMRPTITIHPREQA